MLAPPVSTGFDVDNGVTDAVTDAGVREHIAQIDVANRRWGAGVTGASVIGPATKLNIVPMHIPYKILFFFAFNMAFPVCMTCLQCVGEHAFRCVPPEGYMFGHKLLRKNTCLSTIAVDHEGIMRRRYWGVPGTYQHIPGVIDAIQRKCYGGRLTPNGMLLTLLTVIKRPFVARPFLCFLSNGPYSRSSTRNEPVLIRQPVRGHQSMYLIKVLLYTQCAHPAYAIRVKVHLMISECPHLIVV